MTPAIQTLWAELIAASLADCGVVTCVLSPGSRSTPLVAALAREPRLHLATIIDERAAAWFALGAARATGLPAAIVCTSGTAAAHYLPAVIEASLAAIPLVVITADRPPELHACGASQTIPQLALYGDFVRAALDLGAPVGTALALRALRRKLVQSVTLARGPHAGPVHLDVPLCKPLEPRAPSTDDERALAVVARELRRVALVAPPTLAADRSALDRLAAALAAEPRGLIVAGAMPVAFGAAREVAIELAARLGYPIAAEAGSQLRLGARDDRVVWLDHLDLIPIDARPAPRLIVQLGAEPVAASWPGWLARTSIDRWVLAAHTWHDAESSARAVIIGDVAASLAQLAIAPRPPDPWAASWQALETRAAGALEAALAAAPCSEPATVRAAISAAPAHATIQLGNSLAIRVVDQVCMRGAARPVLTQRGAAGIDGLIASAAGATRAGRPVLLVLGDVSFAHDLGGLLAARCASAPLAILVIDNAGGRIFDDLPIARAELGGAFAAHFLTAPGLDPAAVATALGARAVTAGSPARVAAAVAAALATAGVTVIHAPVPAASAREVRTAAVASFESP